ncbi:MAG: tetratricopeptide repeat protein [Neisseria sp.]|nr:tetratricopeptide repeat protein [Neisseria sp.]
MAIHIDEQESLDNFRHFWKGWGRWLFAVLLVAALAYLGHVLYQNHLVKKDQEAAEVLAQMVEKARNQGDQSAIRADLANLQQNYPGSIAAAQGTLMAAATEFDNGKYDVAEGHLSWVLNNQKAPLVQALAAQRLAVVYLQQKKYDQAINALNAQVAPDFEPLLLETKGDVYLAQGQQKEALAAYEQTLAKLPKDATNKELVQLKIDQLK